MNFEQLLKLTVSVIADMTYTSVLNDHTFYIHFAFAIIFKKKLHMTAKVDFYFIVIHTFCIGYQTSKLVITQPRSQWIHRVLSGASFKLSKKSSFEYPLV
mgnify:CR=1 FL=1